MSRGLADQRYSWCSPLRIGVAPTREHGGSRWPAGAGQFCSGVDAGTPGPRLVNGNHPIHAHTPDRADYAFTESIGLRRPDRRFQYLEAYGRDRPIDSGGVNGDAVMNEEPMRGLAREDGPALLNRPGRGRMFGDVPVEDPPPAD